MTCESSPTAGVTVTDAAFVVVQFRVTKLPVLTVHDVALDDREVERTKRIVERVWNAIQSEHYYPNPSPMNCGSCPFSGPCRAWNG